MYSDAISGDGNLPLPLTQYLDLIAETVREQVAQHSQSPEEEILFLDMMGLL